MELNVIKGLSLKCVVCIKSNINLDVRMNHQSQ